MKTSNSILDGVYPLVDDWLELTSRGKPPFYTHRSAALQVSERHAVASASDFLKAAYEQIDSNWHRAVDEGRYSRSKQNWRFEKRTDISPDNNSPEVKTERAIVRGADDSWVNQVPTSSGLVGPHSDTTRNIDLVRRDDEGNYNLIELKIGSDTPLYAAIEILLYGVLLAWSRNNAADLGYSIENQPLLSANAIQLSTLAPQQYYQGLALAPLGAAINEGLESCLDLLGLPYAFEYAQFRPDFSISDSDAVMYQQASARETIWSPDK